MASSGSDNAEGSGNPVGFKVRESVEAFSRADHGYVEDRSKRDLQNLSECFLLGLVEAVDDASDGCRVSEGNEEETPI